MNVELRYASHPLDFKGYDTEKIRREFLIEKVFLKDEHPLMHKATGWMLREVGKRDKKALCDFLDLNANQMPRIMLSYAIEKFDEKERKKFLKP